MILWLSLHAMVGLVSVIPSWSLVARSVKIRIIQRCKSVFHTLLGHGAAAYAVLAHISQQWMKHTLHCHFQLKFSLIQDTSGRTRKVKGSLTCNGVMCVSYFLTPYFEVLQKCWKCKQEAKLEIPMIKFGKLVPMYSIASKWKCCPVHFAFVIP